MNTLLRFGLGTLLFLTACVGGFFGGYRSGYQRGAAEYLATQRTTEEYFLADLITIDPKQEDIDFVTQTLRETVGDRHDWADVGGYATIAYNPEHLSLLVTHKQACHREIQAFLRTLRLGRSLNDPNHDVFQAAAVPRPIVHLDIKELLPQPAQGKPGFGGLSAAIQKAAPKAYVGHITEEGKLVVQGNLVEIHQMKVLVAAIKQLKYVDRTQLEKDSDDNTLLHDRAERKICKQDADKQTWTLSRTY